MKRTTATPAGAAVERFRRALLRFIGVLAVVEVGVVLSGIWLGFSWFVVAFMIFLAVGVVYLIYLVRRFTRPS